MVKRNILTLCIVTLTVHLNNRKCNIQRVQCTLCTEHCIWHSDRAFHFAMDCASKREEVHHTTCVLCTVPGTRVECTILTLTVHLSKRKCSIQCTSFTNFCPLWCHSDHQKSFARRIVFFFFGYCWLWSAKLPWNHTFEVLKRCLVNFMVMVNDHYHDIHCWDNDDDFFECDFFEYDDDDFFDCDTCINSLSWIPERSFGAAPTVERWIDLM